MVDGQQQLVTCRGVEPQIFADGRSSEEEAAVEVAKTIDASVMGRRWIDRRT